MSADAFTAAPVFICEKCGRGFLTAQPFGIDQYPLWKMLSATTEGPVCGGQIRTANREVKNAGPAPFMG